jgi:hypothetical protein
MATGYNKNRSSNTGWQFGSVGGSWGGTGSTNRGRSTGTSATRGRSTGFASGYTQVGGSFMQKINSFKTLINQAKGAASNRPSPTTLNTFANWVNKGANVFTVTTAQLNRWCGKNHAQAYNFSSPTGCKNFLSNKFGKSTIKAVAKGKSNGSWIVACAPTWKGRPFQIPTR